MMLWSATHPSEHNEIKPFGRFGLPQKNFFYLHVHPASSILLFVAGLDRLDWISRCAAWPEQSRGVVSDLQVTQALGSQNIIKHTKAMFWKHVTKLTQWQAARPFFAKYIYKSCNRSLSDALTARNSWPARSDWKGVCRQHNFLPPVPAKVQKLVLLDQMIWIRTELEFRHNMTQKT